MKLKSMLWESNMNDKLTTWIIGLSLGFFAGTLIYLVIKFV